MPVGYRDIFIGGGGQRGHCPPPPLRSNFDNPKRSEIWYVTRGAISPRVAAAVICESAACNGFLDIFKPFLCFVIGLYLDL